MKKLKNDVIELINEIVGTGTKSFDLTGDEFFDSCPVSVPHDSSMIDTQVEYTISKDTVRVESRGEHLGWDDEDSTFSLDQLSLLQLSLILERIG